MKIAQQILFLSLISSLLFLLPACKNKDELKLVEWNKAEMYQLPQQVIDFYYSVEESPKKLFTVMDSTYSVDESFSKVSNLTETHYTIHINHQPLQIRERDFRAPFLIFNGRLYFSKSVLLRGKLMTPQDLFINFVDLKTVLH